MVVRNLFLCLPLLSANVAILGVRSNGPPVSLTDPVGKVMELLDVLYKQLDENGKKDATVYQAFDAANQQQVSELSAEIESKQSETDSLKADLEEQEALRQAKRLELEQESNSLAKAEKDLQDSKDECKAEHEEFRKAEATLVNGVDSLKHTLVVLAKQMPANGGEFVEVDASGRAPDDSTKAHAESLLGVARNLRKTLEHGDLTLTAMERQTLDGFFRAAAESSSIDGSSRPLDFVQMKSHSSGPYESQTGGVQSTLQSVLEQADQELEEARTKAAKSKADCDKFQQSLESQIVTSKDTITNLKTLIAQSQESSSTKEAQGQMALGLLKTATDQKEAAVAQNLAKAAAYEGRVKERTEEALAVEEATRIMTSETAQRLLAKDDKAFVQTSAPGIPSLLQVKVHSRHILRRTDTPALALLALKMQTNLRRHQLDPFAKVREMVAQMLKKLREEQAQEMKHQQWCDREMSKSAKDHQEKTADVLKLKNRIGAAEVESAQLAEDIASTVKDIAAMQQVNAEATKVRQEENAVSTGAMKNYKDAVSLLNDAVAVLKKFYGGYGDTLKITGTEDEEGMGEHKTKWGLGGGVIAILEVAVEDYQTLYDTTKLNEDAAAQEFKDLINTSQVSLAKFEKDLEYKRNAQVKLQSAAMQMRQDKNSYAEELKAVDEYISKLKEQCIVQPDTYEEKKQRREQEIAGLKGALESLNAA